MSDKSNCSWPLLLLLLMLALSRVRSERENINDTTASEDRDDYEATSPSPSIPETTDRLLTGDLRKAARVEQLPPPLGSGLASKQEYDVIDVLASTNAVVGKPKSGQTTRIYTTGEVDDNFWMKHLGEDFKHAIHLQVGGTNEEYNRLINQTQNGIHEEVHHEYLPGAERPGPQQQQQQRARYMPRNPHRQQQPSLEGEALAMKQRYLIQQQKQQQQRYGYTQQHSQHYTPRAHTHLQQQEHTHTHAHTHTHQLQPHAHQIYQRPHTHKQQQQQQVHYINHRPPIRTIINSSEDQLHAAQSSPGGAATSASGIQAAGGVGRSADEDESDTFGSQLPFKSPFNDYGSRPTRDLTYLLYRRGL
ncbi:G-box-binding factor [Drosophila guanche]|uniref:Uncharacterized protein n=1 Tax=Drosophila guanche TaxID=7266 RepID=A0A3B0JWX7_DROGU|nr:G-box-binding factor [Drosophila guanche]SPP86554.1 Hypothetical predicted protein [Drosophila guanche]